MGRPKKNPDDAKTTKTQKARKRTVKKATGERKPRAVTVPMLERKITTLQKRRDEIDKTMAEYRAEIEKLQTAKTEEEKRLELTKTLLEKLSVEELQALLDKSEN